MIFNRMAEGNLDEVRNAAEMLGQLIIPQAPKFIDTKSEKHVLGYIINTALDDEDDEEGDEGDDEIKEDKRSATLVPDDNNKSNVEDENVLDERDDWRRKRRRSEGEEEGEGRSNLASRFLDPALIVPLHTALVSSPERLLAASPFLLTYLQSILAQEENVEENALFIAMLGSLGKYYEIATNATNSTTTIVTPNINYPIDDKKNTKNGK